MNLSPLVTLIDPDPRGLATLAYSFEKERFTVTGTSELNRAKQLIGATGSRVALIALRSPEQAALETISELRSALATRTLPIVAFGAPALRNAAIAAGAFDYLDTPMLVRDASVVCRLWLYVRGPTSDRDTVPDMVGSLDLLHGLFFLMRAMGSTGRSGVLQLTRGNRKAEVKFTDGAVTSAELRGMQAFPALHQLLLWAGAELSLKLRHVPRRAQFSAKGAEILEECERFLRDVTHAARQLGSLQTVFAIDARQGGALQAGVPEEVAPVARFFDGSRTLGEVIEESPFRVFDTLRVVKRLIDSGVLMPRTATAPSTGSHPAVPVHGNPSAVPRARTRSGAQIPVARSTQPRGMETLTAERRGADLDRRKSARRTPVPFEKPAAKPAPAPIPLVTKKSPSGGFAAGEIRAATRPRLTPQKPVAALKREPSVEVRLDAVPLSLDSAIPDSVPNAAPAPAAAQAAAAAQPATAASARAPAASQAATASAVTSLGHAAAAAAPVAAVPVTAAPVASAPVARAPAAGAAPVSARQSSPAVKPTSKKSARTKTPVPGAPAFSDLEADFFAREADLYKSDSGDTFEDLDGGGKPRPVRAEGSRGIRSRKK
jgi:DNA-binding response OmpR family regulator